MAIYVITAICLVIFALFELVFSKKNYFTRLLFFITSCVLVLTAGLRYGLETDYWHYTNIYNGVTHVSALEPGFVAYNHLLRFLGIDVYLYFFLTALISLGLKLRVFSKLKYPFLITALFYFRLFILFELNAVRQSLACAIVIYAVFRYMEKENDKEFIILVLIAALFHATSLLIISILPLKKAKISLLQSFLMFLGVYLFRFFLTDWFINLGIKYVPRILSATTNLIKGTQYIFNGQNKMSPFSYLSLIRIMLSYYAYYWIVSHCNNDNKARPLLNAYLVASLINVFFMGYNTIDYRLSCVVYCCEGLLMSYSIENVKSIATKKKYVSVVVCIIIILCCNIYSFVAALQTSNTAIPYKSIISELL